LTYGYQINASVYDKVRRAKVLGYILKIADGSYTYKNEYEFIDGGNLSIYPKPS
jgi:hypothetical protein